MEYQVWEVFKEFLLNTDIQNKPEYTIAPN